MKGTEKTPMKTANNTLTTLFVSLLMAFTVTSCSTFPHRPPDQAVKLRVEELMNAKINKDWEKAYTFFDSAYKKTQPEHQFLSNISKMEFKAFTIETITVAPDGKHATVIMKTDITTNGFDFKGNQTTQQWVKEGRQWFLYMPPLDKENPLN
jgi:hypothetical protein